MKHIALTLGIVFMAVSGWASSVCSGYGVQKSTAPERQELLKDTKQNLILKANESIVSIQNAKKYLVDCQDRVCREVKQHFISALSEQMRISKMLTVLSKSDILFYEPVLKVELMLQRGELDADSVTTFNLAGFSFSEREKQMAFELWKKTFSEFIKDFKGPREQPSGSLQHQINDVFSMASLQLVNMNPLLPFLTEAAISKPSELFKAFDKLIEFNHEFLAIVAGYRTEHKTGFWSYVNLAVPDHEMGLVNFPSQIEYTIATKPESSRKNLCNAWHDLETQQKWRVRTSIGVGFTAAVVCGVGVWSGVGTIPAAALCSFAVADGVWGSYVGIKDSNMGYYSAYAGKVLNMHDVEFSEGVQNTLDAKHLQASGRAVFVINMIGLVPIARSVMTVTKGVRGTLRSLIVVPSADVAGASSEAGTSRLVYVLLTLRGLELSTDSLTEIMASL